ncbi:MAG TPA: ester cyclase [Actinocrinis sp.]|nr:ester cyclase [Actinocrinis sp.]
MSIETNKTVARRYYEEFVNERRLDVLEEIVAEDAIDETRAFSGGSGDRDDFRQHALWLWESVQDVKATVTDLVAEGDRVVVYWRIEGIHRGTIFGVPGSGKAFTGNSISTLTFSDGKVVRYTVLPDRLGIIEQIGGAGA